MPREEDTHARLMQFFATHQEQFEKLYREPCHVEVWEEIFHHFFGDYPQDDMTKEHPTYWRAGSTDPRWDTLLFKEKLGAMRAVNHILNERKAGRLIFPPYKEAA